MSHKKEQKTKAEITDIRGSGNSDGGHIGASGRITHKPSDNTEVYIQGNIDHYQPFKGGQPGQTSGSGVIGFGIKY